ncbi:MAG: SDR family oxidoreductase [candidate division Zixibacteria bacterium]|nr:SDR family oxidoreductase [candidate division Zixibacteria bacterium]MDD5426258.1 SDR family oxidoreductase [candidate division Zixibacteria bacterium]
MDLHLKGKKALVTGASAGLGAAVAMELAREGVTLIINSRSEERLSETAQKIEKVTSSKPKIVVADVATIDGLEKIARSITNSRGKSDIDILFSNTGGPPTGQFLNFSDEVWDESADLLLKSAYKLTRLVLNGMIERRWGRLIYLTSISVLQPVDDLILSNTYRAAVTAFCKTVSNNYAQFGITANCVCPGYTATERLTNLSKKRAEVAGTTPEEIMKDFASKAAVKRVGKPEELAALVAFLASDRAAFITGSSIAVDGGSNRALI